MCLMRCKKAGFPPKGKSNRKPSFCTKVTFWFKNLGHVINLCHFHALLATSGSAAMEVLSAWHGIPSSAEGGLSLVESALGLPAGNNSRILQGLPGRKASWKSFELRHTIILAKLFGRFKEVIKWGLILQPRLAWNSCVAQDGLELVVVSENSCKEAVFTEAG